MIQPELKGKERVIPGVFLDGVPLVVEDGYESLEIAEEVAREEKVALYRGKQKCEWKENEENSSPKTFTKKEIAMLDLKEKYGGRKSLRKKDILELYRGIGALYNVGQVVPKIEVHKRVSEIYGRKLDRSHLSRQLRICIDAGVLEVVSNKLIVFKQEPEISLEPDHKLNDNELEDLIKEASLITSIEKHRFKLNTALASLSVEFKDLARLLEILALGKSIVEPLIEYEKGNG